MTEKLRPFRPISPGEILKDELDARGWTQSDLAEILGRPVQVVNEIASGKKAITPATAVELSQAFGTSPEFWLNLESAYRLDLLHGKDSLPKKITRRAKVYSLAPVKELAKMGWIADSKDLDTIEREVCRLLEIKSIDDKPRLAFAARKSDPYSEFSPAQVAWACRARQVSQKQRRINAFDRQGFNEQIPHLPELSVGDGWIARVSKTLAGLGVRLVVVHHLPNSKIDGAAFWLDAQSPVVALSLRYDRIDHCWFTLMHELAHIKMGRKLEGFLDINLVGPSREASKDKPRKEQEADSLAAAWLMPQSDVDTFVTTAGSRLSAAKIAKFAEGVGIHPGIVVGRLQHLGVTPYNHHRAMLVKVRDEFASALGNV